MEGTTKKVPDSARSAWHPGTNPLNSIRNETASLARRADDLPSERYVLARGGYKVRLADTPGQRNRASMLINSMYTWRGYSTYGMDLLHRDPHSITLEAASGHQLIGTLTLGLDSDEGLLADQLFHNEIEAFRATEGSVCEMTKLAFDPQHSSKEVIASLFHLAYIYAHDIYEATDLFIEVNPRHVQFYQNRLGFTQRGKMRTCRRVNAPAVLMHVPLDYVAQKISSCAGLRDSSEKSLYPYFFSEAEIQGLSKRIRAKN